MHSADDHRRGYDAAASWGECDGLIDAGVRSEVERRVNPRPYRPGAMAAERGSLSAAPVTPTLAFDYLVLNPCGARNYHRRLTWRVESSTSAFPSISRLTLGDHVADYGARRAVAALTSMSPASARPTGRRDPRRRATGGGRRRPHGLSGSGVEMAVGGRVLVERPCEPPRLPAPEQYDAVRSGLGGAGTASAGTASGCGSGLDAAGSTNAAGVGQSRSVAAGASAATGCETGPGAAVNPEVAAGTAAESSGEARVVVQTWAAPTLSWLSDPTSVCACTVSSNWPCFFFLFFFFFLLTSRSVLVLFEAVSTSVNLASGRPRYLQYGWQPGAGGPQASGGLMRKSALRLESRVDRQPAARREVGEGQREQDREPEEPADDHDPRQPRAVLDVHEEQDDERRLERRRSRGRRRCSTGPRSTNATAVVVAVSTSRATKTAT